LVDSVVFYISAARDLRRERDLLSQLTTELPVTLGWEIHLTPLREKKIDQKLIQEAHLHLLVLGEDIRAPVGYEWWIARRAHRTPILLYRRGIARTPGALDFHRALSKSYTWQPYDDLENLRRIALTSIGGYLLDHSGYFELDQNEVEGLSTFLEHLRDSEPGQLDEIYGGTGEDSIIISPERYVPSSGVLITKPGQENDEG
jgi:hypothetical protein